MRDRSALIGGALVLVLVALALLGPVIARKDPVAGDIDHGLSAIGAPLPPSHDALLGTDALGRDEWARIAAGAGTSLVIATAATLITLVLGLAIGLTAGYAGGALDNLLMRLVDLVLAFPFVLVAILLAALVRQSDVASARAPVYLTLGVLGWTTGARMIRNQTALVMRSELITAARALGAGPWRIATRHVLPNITGLVVVITALGFAQNLLAESVLSFVGLGPPPPAASWGRMLYEGRAYYRIAPHLVLAPGVAILLAVIGFNLLGEGVRAALAAGEPR
jgi:ABC-type dipeptide/oligopeptide/nickel transport system permease subunit